MSVWTLHAPAYLWMRALGEAPTICDLRSEEKGRESSLVGFTMRFAVKLHVSVLDAHECGKPVLFDHEGINRDHDNAQVGQLVG